MMSSERLGSATGGQVRLDAGPTVDPPEDPAAEQARSRSDLPAESRSDSPAECHSESTAESLSVNVAYRDPAPPVELAGSLTARTAPLVAVALESPIRAGYRMIEVSLARVTSVTFAGAAPLLRAHDSLRQRGRTLRVLAASAPAQTVLAGTRLLQMERRHRQDADGNADAPGSCDGGTPSGTPPAPLGTSGSTSAFPARSAQR